MSRWKPQCEGGRALRGIFVVSFVLLASSAVSATAAYAQVPVNLNPPTIASNPPNQPLVTATVTDSGSRWGPMAISTSVSVAEPPQNTSRPVITGKPMVGARLSVTTGTWSNDGSPTTFAYQWELCAPLCDHPIPDATGRRYTVPSSAAGRGLDVLVTAVSDGGTLSGEVYSEPVAIPVKTVAPMVSPIAQLVGNPMIPPGQQSSLAHLLTHDGYRTAVTVGTIGRLEITWTSRLDDKNVTLASGRASYKARGAHSFRLKLTRKGKALLRTSRHLAFSDTAWYITRNPSNLQWGECRYRATKTARHALKFGALNCGLNDPPPRLSL